ncbi:MAG: hypothetical protein Q7R43_05690 [Candidatus Daviesbacteria bacterium]|nr:hypothetical protein [Candidatus Daviesbacteria bacterium]
MIRNKIIVVIIIFFSALFIFIYVSIHGGQRNGGNLKSPESNILDIKSTSTPVPIIWLTPTPIILDLKNGLSKEVEKLTPEDFSLDFETLKKSF